MADTPGAPQPPGRHKLYYALTPEVSQELRRADPALTAAEWRLWSLLVTLDPFGDRYQDLPDLLEIMQECDLKKSTFYVALAKFEELKLFDTQPLRIAFRNLRGQRIVRNLGNNSEKPETSPKSRNDFQNLGNDSEKPENIFSESAQGNASRNGNVPITDQTCSKEQTNIGASTPDRTGGNLVHPQDLSLLLKKISEAGLNPNKTIQSAIATLQQQLLPDAVERAVDNALSALQEQQQKQWVRNPGGFFVAALRRNFTANEAKRNARAKQTDAAPRASPPQAFDAIASAQQIDTYLLNGRRDWAIAKLKHLQNDHPDAITELLSLRYDWQIRPTDLLQEPSP